MENSIMPNQDDLTQILEEFKARFPEANPMYIPLLLLSIDIETWTFPEIFHHGAIGPQIEFIEKNELLKNLFQKQKQKRENAP